MRQGIVGIFGLLGLMVLRMAPAHAGDTVYYYYDDAQGTPVVVTDAHGNVIERTYYGPYGEVLNRPLRDGPGYTGHEEDAATGLVYMQQRYYDPQSHRFPSVDPVDVDPNTGANFNRYAYANDNPYRYTDPDGRCPDKNPCAQPVPKSQEFFQSNPVGKIISAVVGNTIAAFRSDHENPLSGEALNAAQVTDAKLGVLTMAAPIGKTEQVVAEGVKAAEPMARGIASEARVLAYMGLTKNTTAVSTAEGRAIPDALTSTASYEIKDTARVSATSQ